MGKVNGNESFPAGFALTDGPPHAPMQAETNAAKAL